MAKENIAHRVSAFNHVISRITSGSEKPLTGGGTKPSVYVQQMYEAVKPLGSGMSALISMHQNRDPTQTTSANDRKIITTAMKLGDRRKQAFEKVMQQFRNGVQDLELRINEKVVLKANPEVASEIRAVIRSMKPADRKAALAQMAATNDGAALAAIIEAPAILTGITAEEQTRYRTMIYSIHAKDELAEQTALNEALDVAMKATDIAGLLAKDLGNEDRLREIEIGVDAAAKAEAAFAAAPMEG